MSAPQQYCLRWNNHRSNLLTVFDQLLQNEAFTDVTLACEGGTSVKCHKMVLAACSSYFQGLFTELPCRHPVVVLKDVRYGEMKAILEYMYRGEVNVAHDQLAALLKVAEALKVKGLVEENGTVPRLKNSDEEGNAISTSSSTAQSAGPPSSSVPEGSQPHSSTGKTDYSRFPYGKSEERSSSRVSFPMWGVSGLPLGTPPPPNSPYSSAALNRCYEAITADMPPLRRKKLSSLLMSRDTPILRTVLGQGQADSSQPVPLVCRPDSNEHPNYSPFTNGSAPESIKESTSEDAPSPFTDISAVEEEDRQNKFTLHSSSPQPFYGENKDGILSGIATYVPTPKPEWKRYKQYTRNDIMSAIEAVRNGMTALQASRLYKVPSRTLYDKVKKLGITTSRPFRRSSNGNGSAAFPYSMSGTGSMVYGNIKHEDSYSSAVMEHGFLHHTFEAHNIKREEVEREAAVAMVAASNVADNSSAEITSPVTNERSQSPNLIKYARPSSASPSSPRDMDDESDRVEDLSISRKADTPTGPRVIMPPMSSSQSSAPVITTIASTDTPENID